MTVLKDQQADEPAPMEPRDHAEDSRSASTVASSARASRLLRTGSLERLLAEVDAMLPGHLRRLAAATNALPPGRGVRVGVLPKHVVIEWRTVGSVPEHFALTWQCTQAGLTFGGELLELERIADESAGWNDLLSHEQEGVAAEQQIEHLSERLEQVTAERDRLAERLTSTPVTSSLRRRSPSDHVADDLFIRTIRRR